MGDPSWSDVTKKQDQDDQELKENDVLLDAIEADLTTMETAMQKAQARYEEARLRVARQLKEVEKTEGKSSPHIAPSEDHPIDVAEILPPDDHKHEHHKKLQKEPKNSGALPDKVVSRQRWLAARGSEKRARESAKRGREMMRLRQRDRKFEAGYVAQDAEAAAAAPEPAPAPEKLGPEVTESELEAGAKQIVERLLSVQKREKGAEKRSALVKCCTCGRDNFYTFKPEEVLYDLQHRGLLDEKVVEEFLELLTDTSLVKPAKVPLKDWLEHAKKVSSMERKDDMPWKAAEAAYLGFLDGRTLQSTEAELEAAEAQLAVALDSTAAASARYAEAVKVSGLQVALDETEQQEWALSVEEAEHFDAQHSHDKFESHGTKNAGALPDK
ncbi:unnamed protein product, partial [Effrenium voratum]